MCWNFWSLQTAQMAPLQLQALTRKYPQKKAVNFGAPFIMMKFAREDSQTTTLIN